MVCDAVQAQMERMGRDASNATHLQQQLQAKDKLLGEADDAIRQAKVCLTLLAYVRRDSASCCRISLSCMWHEMHCHLGGKSGKKQPWLHPGSAESLAMQRQADHLIECIAEALLIQFCIVAC